MPRIYSKSQVRLRQPRFWPASGSGLMSDRQIRATAKRYMPNLDQRRKLIDALESAAQPLQSTADDYRAMINAAKNKNYVLLGEATHGTADFYRIRADITRHLIVE